MYQLAHVLFSSLSESGFIPTGPLAPYIVCNQTQSSHLFQRVASFLHVRFLQKFLMVLNAFSSLSESGFIPTFV